MQGTDWYDLSKKCRMLGPYYLGLPGDMLQYETIRSFSTRDDDFRYAIIGSYREMVSHEWLQRGLPWLAVLHGCNGLLWFGDFRTAGSASDSISGLAPDFRPARAYRWSLEEIRRIQSGIYHLVRSGRRQHDRVAVLFSRPSIYATDFRSFAPMTAAVQECGFQFLALDARELDQGRLRGDEFAAVFLPAALCLSDRGLDEVQRFVARGGTAVADLLPAVMTDHGCARPSNPLAAVFGVGDEPGKVPQPRPCVLRLKEPSTAAAGTLELSLPGAIATLAGGTARGRLGAEGLPAVIVNRHGAGRTLLLNFALVEGPADGQRIGEGKTEAYRHLVASGLELAGLKPAVAVADAATGEPIQRGMEIVRYHRGQSQYVAMLAAQLGDNAQPRRTKITLPRAGHLYDVRAGRYLGHSSAVTTEFQPGPAQFFAVLPYQVEKLTIEAAARHLSPGKPLEYTVRIHTQPETAEQHVVRVEVFDPSGKELRHYRQVAACDGPTLRGLAPLALNDPCGTWRLRAVDVASGAAAETTFELPPPLSK